MIGKKIYLGQTKQNEVSVDWHRAVIGLLLGVAIMMLVTMLTGCSNQCERKYQYQMIGYYEPTVSPKLLFRSKNDPQVDPQVFAYRSDWPATEGDYEMGRVTTYQEYWYDQQSASGNIPDYSYRQFQSYRTGVSAR